MGDVKPANPVPNRPMLFQDRPVLDRHLPAAKVDEARTEFAVEFV